MTTLTSIVTAFILLLCLVSLALLLICLFNDPRITRKPPSGLYEPWPDHTDRVTRQRSTGKRRS